MSAPPPTSPRYASRVHDTLSVLSRVPGLRVLPRDHSRSREHRADSRWCSRHAADASYADLQSAVDTLSHYAASASAITDLSTSMQADIPQLYFDVDRDRAKMLGIPVSDIFSTMKAFTGSIYVNDFNMFNRIYRVYIQADATYRARRENIGLFFVKSTDGTMVPVSSLGTSSYTTGPGTIRRFNMFNAATMSGEAAKGYSTGEAMDALEEIVRKHLPDNIGVEWSGLSYQQKHESGNTGLVLGLAFLFVFLFLAAPLRELVGASGGDPVAPDSRSRRLSWHMALRS